MKLSDSLLVFAAFSISIAPDVAAALPEQAPAAGQCTTVPWLEPGKPIVRASINGRELTFLVDTGAEYDGWIKPEVARALGLPVVGMVPDDEDEATNGLPFYGIDRLQLGSIVFSGRRFGEMPDMGAIGGGFDGMIGNGLFARMQATFDYQRDVLQVTDQELTGGAVVEIDRYGIPVLTLDIGDTPVKVHLDTGNLAAALLVTEAEAAALAFTAEPARKGRAMTVSGPIELMEAPLADPVRHAGTVLPITAVRWPGAYGSGQLGSKGLAGHTVRIDWRPGSVQIGQEDGAPRCS